MNIRLPYQDPTSERLLLVVLEDAQYPQSDYRHIRATVVRRAVPHKLRADAPAIYDGTGVEVWNDDHAQRCSGYRVASYVKQARQDIYVDDMQLRGQIDAMPRPMRDGKPYGNKIVFKPYQVQMDSAKAIFEFFRKMEIFKTRYNLNRSGDDFYVELNHLAQFLKLTRVLFYKPGVRHTSLEETSNFFECDIALCEEHINKMLAPFLQNAA